MLNIKEIKNIKKGQWIFTCSMQPRQFKSFEGEDEPNPGTLRGTTYTDDQWWAYLHDEFLTMEGSSHSIHNCGCQPISEKYAKWFLENECWKLFPDDADDDKKWDIYENLVKDLCKKDKIKYEGI